MASKRSSVRRTTIPFNVSATTIATATAQTASPQVLIVEDEMLLARELEAHLVELGYSITAIALSAPDAIAILKTQPVDIVLMDIMLSGEMDGIATAVYVRQEFHLPIIYLTAYSDVHMLSQAAFTCPSGYLMKPCTTTDLRITLEIALAQHQLEDELRQALINAERLKTVDNVTGILTAPRLLSMAEKEFHRARRYQHPFSLMMLNITPMVEGSRGGESLHDQGMSDRILSTIAHTIQHCLRQADYLGHLETEGFGLILPETNAQSAITVAERIRQALILLPLQDSPLAATAVERPEIDSPPVETLVTTVSIGVAEWGPTDSEGMDIFRRAENALRQAQRQGDNAIVVQPI